MAGEPERESNLERLARQPEPGLASEFLEFLSHNRKWWLLPILLVLGLAGVLAVLAATGAAPFLYTLF
jgi:uncharacterized protein YdaL